MQSAFEILEGMGVVEFSSPDLNMNLYSLEQRKYLFFEALRNFLRFNYPVLIYPDKPDKGWLQNFKIWDSTVEKVLDYYCSEEGFCESFSIKRRAVALFNCFAVHYGEITSTEYNKWVDIRGLLEFYFGGLKLKEVFPTYNSK